MGRFAEAYRDPAEFGLDYVLVRRLLPDGDLEALPRRAFAFPVLEGWHSGTDLSSLDPAEPRDRRAPPAAGPPPPAPGGARPAPGRPPGRPGPPRGRPPPPVAG